MEKCELEKERVIGEVHHEIYMQVEAGLALSDLLREKPEDLGLGILLENIFKKVLHEVNRIDSVALNKAA